MVISLVPIDWLYRGEIQFVNVTVKQREKEKPMLKVRGVIEGLWTKTDVASACNQLTGLAALDSAFSP